jgi:hypothetical protein
MRLEYIQQEASSVEPTLATAPELLAVLEELKRREPIFHNPEFGTSRRDFEQMTDESYWEVGASGRRYSREFVLKALDCRIPQPGESAWKTNEFHCQQIAPDNFLLAYTLHQGMRVTRRATIWRRTTAGWKIVYHQGTIASPEALADEAPRAWEPFSARL